MLSLRYLSTHIDVHQGSWVCRIETEEIAANISLWNCWHRGGKVLLVGRNHPKKKNLDTEKKKAEARTLGVFSWMLESSAV